MAPGSPEQGPQIGESVDVSPAVELASQLENLGDLNNAIPEDLLESLATGDEREQDLYQEFLSIEADGHLSPEERDVLNVIDGLIGIDQTFIIDTDGDGLPDIYDNVDDRTSNASPVDNGYTPFSMPLPSYLDLDNDGQIDFTQITPTHMDVDGDGQFDIAQTPGVNPMFAAAAPTADMPPVTAPPVDGAPAQNDLASKKGPEQARLSTEQARDIFLSKIGDYVSWDASETVMTISGMDKLATQVSRVNDFFGPDSPVKKTDNPNDYVLHSKDKDYTWNAEHRTWIESGKTSYDDRLKVFNGTTVRVERKAVERPDPVPAKPDPIPAPVEPVPTAPEEPEGMPDPPVKPTKKEVREEADRIAQGKEFTQNLLNAETEMAALEKQFDKVNRLDTKDVDEGNVDRYQRELGELKKMRDAAGEMLTDLGAEFTTLQENGVFPPDTPSTELRIARMDAMNTSFRHINHVMEHTLEDDEDAVGEKMHHRLTPREARDQRLDAEWKDETMPRINGVVAGVDENMSVDGEADVSESGFRGNNKTLRIRHTSEGPDEGQTTTRRFNSEIKIRFRQVLPDDNYHEINTNLVVKYDGVYYQTIDDAVKKAAQDFKAMIDKRTAKAEPEPAPVEPTPEPAPTAEPVTPAEAPPKEAPKAEEPRDAEKDGEGTTDDADLEATAAAPGTVEATHRQTQEILKDVALLPTTRVVEGRRVPLAANEAGFTGIIKSPSGEAHNYLQHVNADGYIDQRYVQLEGEGDWLAIPYSNFIEQEKAKDYEGIEADDPDKKDRQQYRPDRDSAAWQNRHKGRRMTLTKRSE